MKKYTKTLCLILSEKEGLAVAEKDTSNKEIKKARKYELVLDYKSNFDKTIKNKLYFCSKYTSTMKKSLLIILIISVVIFIINILLVYSAFSTGNDVQSYKQRVFDLGMEGRINFIIGILLTIPTIIIGPDKTKINKILFWTATTLIFINAVTMTMISTVYSN